MLPTLKLVVNKIISSDIDEHHHPKPKPSDPTFGDITSKFISSSFPIKPLKMKKSKSNTEIYVKFEVECHKMHISC